MKNPLKTNWKKREGVVYSTDKTFEYEVHKKEEEKTIPPPQQHLRVSLDKSGRAGKSVTLVTGFIGSSEDLEILGKLLKTRCGTGGSTKGGEVLIQGDVRDKIVQVLQNEGYKAKRSG